MMAIFRKAKVKDFTIIDNGIFRDKALSFKAKGLLCHLLSLPDNWKVYISEIARHGADGERAVRSGMRELLDKGYLVKYVIRNTQNQIIEHVYDIHEIPTERATLLKGTCGKQPTINTYLNNNEQFISSKVNTKEFYQSQDGIPTSNDMIKTEYH